MNKKLTTILLASSVVALAALQPVGAEGTTNNAGADSTAAPATETKKFKEIRYVIYQNGKIVDIKDSLKGDAASNTTPPKIDGYTYSYGRDGKDDGFEGVLFHMYTKNTNSNSNSGNGSQNNSNNSNQNNGVNNNNQNNGGTANQNSSSTNYVWTIKDGKKYLKVDGKPASGFTTFEGKKYFFLADGSAKVGILQEGDKRFYFNAEGEQQLNWQKVGDKYYYFKEDGTILKGIFTVGDKTY